jgi:Tol biopolymer transport system component
MGAANRRWKRGRGVEYRACLIKLGLIVASCALFLSVLPTASALAAPTHSFNALLSLTGGTATEPADPIPDPPPRHPPTSFNEACGTAVDSAGDVYVANFGPTGRIDVFNAAGEFLTEILDPNGPCDLAVDSTGVLYVHDSNIVPARVVRYTPSEFPPTTSTTYGSPTTIEAFSGIGGVAVNASNNHVFLSMAGSSSSHITEYSSAAEGNAKLSEFGLGTVQTPKYVAVDGKTGDVFVGSTVFGESAFPGPSRPFVSVVYVFDASGALIGTVDGSDIPAGGFLSPEGTVAPAVDEATGELFVGDTFGSKEVFRFVPTSGGNYEYAADPQLEDHFYSSQLPARVAVSNASGADNEEYVFVASIKHLFAFGPEGNIGPPLITETAATGVTLSEATLSARLDPNGRATTYHFEYVNQQTFEQSGFANATASLPGSRPAGSVVAVTTSIAGLMPGTDYRFRLVASNCGTLPESAECSTDGEIVGGTEVPREFATFRASPIEGSCPNEGRRIGSSALLPDCRAYERVSPVATGGHEVDASAIGSANGGGFLTELLSDSGEDVVFETGGGTLPGFLGNGFNDRYRAVRTESGWRTNAETAGGSQIEVPSPGGVDAGHGASFWRTGGGAGTPDGGSLVLGDETEYVRRSDGSFSLLGAGALATKADVTGRWISPDGNHAIFTSVVKLEEGAPESGSGAPGGSEGVYDRTPAGLSVISVLPGGQPVPPGASVEYLGSSADGSAVAFATKQGGVVTLLVRRNDSETIEVTTGAPTFAGLSSDGRYVFYVKGGDVFRFDLLEGTQVQIGSGAGSTVVNVSPDGSHVYFVSKRRLTSSGSVPGEENLYVWSSGADEVAFIADLTHADVVGELNSRLGAMFGGLGLWTEDVVSARPQQGPFSGPANDPSRTTPDGRVLVFESRGNLTGEESHGVRQVYRYDGEDGSLICLSCSPTRGGAPGESHLQTLFEVEDERAPLNAYDLVRNIAAGGARIFFESEEPLVATDGNGRQDVYEWEAPGFGGCGEASGCVALISTGKSPEQSYLYGVGGEGRDVLFSTTEALVPEIGAGSRALYDARIDGGFTTESGQPACGLEGCQGPSSAVGAFATPSSANVVGPETARKKKGPICRKGQHKVSKHGKTRCIATHKKHGKHKHAGKGKGHKSTHRGTR